MTNENEMTEEEIDREWQPGPAVEIDWWGGNFSDLDTSVDCECEEDINELELE